jgi:hypothetical protein
VVEAVREWAGRGSEVLGDEKGEVGLISEFR